MPNHVVRRVCCYHVLLSGYEKIMNCVICKHGTISFGYVTVTLQRNETTVILKNVPADVCENCGEYYLSEEVTDKILTRAETAVNNGAEVEILKFAA